VALLTQALTLWHGEPLTGLSGDWVESERDRWQQERFTAEHDLIDAQLRLGHGDELVAQLATRTTQHPLDERVAGQYMLALHRAGRPADALGYYQQLREPAPSGGKPCSCTGPSTATTTPPACDASSTASTANHPRMPNRLIHRTAMTCAQVGEVGLVAAFDEPPVRFGG
jgi:hypothetical protein